MLFRVTYLDPKTKTERTSELTSPDRTALEDHLKGKGIEVRGIEWMSDGEALPRTPEMQPPAYMATPALAPKKRSAFFTAVSVLFALLGCMIGVIAAAIAGITFLGAITSTSPASLNDVVFMLIAIFGILLAATLVLLASLKLD